MTTQLTMVAGSRDLTDWLAGASMSNVDPGGYEMLQCQPPDISRLSPGTRVTVRCGLDIVWDGYVNEPAKTDRDGRSEASLACVGWGTQAKKDAIRQIYVDRDLTKWRAAGNARQQGLISGGFGPIGPQVKSDDAGTTPALGCEITGAWASTATGLCEGWYDSDGIAIASIYYAWTRGSQVLSTDTNWTWDVTLCTDDVATTVDATGNLRAAGPGTGTLTATGASKFYAFAQIYYAAVTAGGNNQVYGMYWTCLAVYGNHGLTKRGAGSATLPPGFYPGDIFGNAMSGLGFEAVTDDSSSVTVTQAAYLQPTTREQVALDMAKLMGWHYGVWEASSVVPAISQPRAFLVAPPTSATCVVRRTECEEVQEPTIRADLLYDTCRVAYRDAAGTVAYVTVTATNAIADAAGYDGGTLELDMGIGVAATATVFANMALALAQSSARGSGSAILPDTVALPGGGRKASCLLKAGRDRIRISDLPNLGSLVEVDGRRFDTFLIRRVETTVDENCIPRTRVEFDTGADLLDTLTARLAAGAVNLG